MNKLKLICITFLLVLSQFSGAESPGPEELAREYFSVMQEEGMTSIGRFMHPQALEDFKAMILPIYQAEADGGQRQLLNMTFGEGMDIETLTTLSPQKFINGFMHIIAAQFGDAKITFDKLEVLGTISEGEARHVLTRVSVGANEIAVTEFEVLSFIPYQNTWRLQLNGKITGMARALRSQMLSGSQ